METATIGNTACLGNSVNRTASPESDPSSLEAARFHELQLGFSGEYSTPGGELNSSIKCSVSRTLHKDATDCFPVCKIFVTSQDLV